MKQDVRPNKRQNKMNLRENIMKQDEFKRNLEQIKGDIKVPFDKKNNVKQDEDNVKQDENNVKQYENNVKQNNVQETNNTNENLKKALGLIKDKIKNSGNVPDVRVSARKENQAAQSELNSKPLSDENQRKNVKNVKKPEENQRKNVKNVKKPEENQRKNVKNVKKPEENQRKNIKVQNKVDVKQNKVQNKVDVKQNKVQNKGDVKKNKLLSKIDLCKIIARHYMVRANLVSAIASALPLHSNPGFCQSRINALEKGELCLPPDYEIVQSLPMLKASSMLSRYVNNFNHGSCKSVNGYYKRHNKERMEKIKENKSSNELQKKYVNHVESMKANYIADLSTLKAILQELLDNPSMTNADLKLLSQKTKETLDEMYTNCQFDYILGVIALLQIDYQLPRISAASMNNLKNALDNRAK